VTFVALVTGASRGVGRGCAIGLGEVGATVWVTGRTDEEGAAAVPLPGSVRSTAAAVDSAGGRGVARRCDHTDDEAVAAVFAELLEQEGRLDVLVNAVWGGYERFVGVGELSLGPFWEQPLALWDSMHVRGVRAAYVASCHAARTMVSRGSGLIVNISSFAAQAFVPPVAYGVAHAAIDRMTADMARELDGTGVTVVSLYPGLVRTENVLANAEHFDLSDSESPQFVGRAVAALAGDADVQRFNGRPLVAAELANDYGFTDVDGARPRSRRGELLDRTDQP
jgi:NAD(P)-dependent dehydrogenase (short-subunit alcohol dehydrogenase family)